MKRFLIILPIILLLCGCNLFIQLTDMLVNGTNGSDFSGAGLVGTYYTYTTNHSYNLAYYNNTLYMADFMTNYLTWCHIDAMGLLYEDSYYSLTDANGIHGITIDPENGTIWACDLDGSRIIHYTADGIFYEMFYLGSCPVGICVNQNMLYIADRLEDKVYCVEKSTFGILGEFDIVYADPGDNSSYIDVSIYADRIYLVGEEIDGIVSLNLDGSDLRRIWPDNKPGFHAMGIQIENGRVYLNERNRIVVTDMGGKVMNRWDLKNPVGYTGYYTDIVVVNGLIYTVSYSNSGNGDSQHILVYREK